MKGSRDGLGLTRRLYLAIACSTIFSLGCSTELKAQSAGNSGSDHPTRVLSSPSWQSLAGGHLEFEVASVKPSQPGSSPGANMSMNTGDYLKPTGGLFTANLPLVTYIVFAYKLSLDHEQAKLLLDSLPKWAATQMFAVHARASSGNPTKDQYRLMMQSLLANRFKLVSHLEHRNVPVFALALVKPGTLGPISAFIATAHPATSPLRRMVLYLRLIQEPQRVAATAFRSIVEVSTSWSGRTTWYSPGPGMRPWPLWPCGFRGQVLQTLIVPLWIKRGSMEGSIFRSSGLTCRPALRPYCQSTGIHGTDIQACLE